MELWWVRHGQTDWNVQKRVQGWRDVPLNAEGVKQAKQLALAMAGAGVQKIYSSDLIRARETAEILQSVLACEVHTTPLLRERCFGDKEGAFREPPADTTDLGHAYPRIEDGPPAAESDQALAARVKTFFAELEAAPLHSGPRVNAPILCVTHGGFVRSMLRTIGVEPPATLRNTGLTRTTLNNGAWSLVALDTSAHLNHDAPVVSESDVWPSQ